MDHSWVWTSLSLQGHPDIVFFSGQSAVVGLCWPVSQLSARGVFLAPSGLKSSDCGQVSKNSSSRTILDTCCFARIVSVPKNPYTSGLFELTPWLSPGWVLKRYGS